MNAGTFIGYTDMNFIAEVSRAMATEKISP